MQQGSLCLANHVQYEGFAFLRPREWNGFEFVIGQMGCLRASPLRMSLNGGGCAKTIYAGSTPMPTTTSLAPLYADSTHATFIVQRQHANCSLFQVLKKPRRLHLCPVRAHTQVQLARVRIPAPCISNCQDRVRGCLCR